MREKKVSLKNLGSNYSIEDLENKLLKTKENKLKYKHRFRKAKDGIHQQNMGKHNSGLAKIVESPETIGIEDYFYHAHTDEDFFQGKRKAGSVDVYLETQNEKIAIEYKCNDGKHNRDYAKKQLIRAKEFLKKNQRISITKMLYVHGEDLKADELTPEGFKPFNYTKTSNF